MKQCPYCGKEYPDDAINCLIDNHPLRSSVPDTSDEETGLKPATDNATYLRYPDYKWTSRYSWKCIGIILILEIVIGLVLYDLATQPGIRRWNATGVGFFCTRLLYYSLFLLAAAYFARTETLASFLTAFGLNRKPSDYVWLGIVMALTIRGIGHFMLVNHFGKGMYQYDVSLSGTHQIPSDSFFLIPMLLLAPIFEETVNRGFLYKAFRGSYPMWASLLLTVVWTAVRHGSQYLHWVAAMDLSFLTLVQCYLREKSESIWDCIFCHLTYNGSLLFL